MTRGGVRTEPAAESSAGGVSVAGDVSVADDVSAAPNASGAAGTARALNELPPAELREALKGWAQSEDTWQPLVRHDAQERTYALLHRDANVEIYLVCWMPDHDTGFHDHDHSAAAITVLEGAITEERLAITGTVETHLRTGDTVTIAREAIHRVRHAGRAPAVTLHAYSPPLQRVGTYEIATNGALLRHPRPAETPLHAVA